MQYTDDGSGGWLEVFLSEHMKNFSCCLLVKGIKKSMGKNRLAFTRPKAFGVRWMPVIRVAQSLLDL